MGYDKELDTKIAFEDFAAKFAGEVHQIARFASFLDLGEEDLTRINNAVMILRNKDKAIRNCSSLKEASKHVKLKKLVGAKNGII